jgi:4-aminobutyrate aminotransferase-like enzyme/Ser/Thr protein kinase RdoA (MazF antagonist)
MRVRYQTPEFTAQDACRLAWRWYGLRASARPLPGERDRNFYLKTDSGQEFVLKIANAVESRESLTLQNGLLAHLAGRLASVATPHVMAATSGETLVTIEDGDSAPHLMRLLTYLPGKVWAEARPHTPDLLRSLGRGLAHMDIALQHLQPPAVAGEFKWNLTQAGWIRDYLHCLESTERRALVERFLRDYEARVAPALPALRSGIIYNDANDYNVLVDETPLPERRVAGFVDFGDVAHSPLICELAVGIAYAAMGKPDPIAAAVQVVAGYHEALPLAEAELAVLFPLICARLCVSVVNAAYQRQVEPANDYLTISEQPAWALLERLAQVNPRFALYAFRHACGLPACPATPAVVDWLRSNPATIGRIVEPDMAAEALVLDLSAGSAEIGDYRDMTDLIRLGQAISERMKATQARVGIGRYGEARLTHRANVFRVEGNDGPEWRTVHLGLDLFMPAGSSVYAPLPGVVHSLRDNAAPLDYGPTIVLKHTVADSRISFYTLYGHLSRQSLKGLQEGQPFERGQQLGTIGDASVNGGWPPHLHFQIVVDMLDRTGEFPGAATPDQREVWLSLCPDPNLIVGAPAGPVPPQRDSAGHILAARRKRLGGNLSLTYDRPLHIVRGWMQWLYDADGRAYLDAVNNVPHVGHCHPRVVKAAQTQLATLNTNTRYLHENIVRLAERLCARLPEPLRVCFFVNSGSEANALALRLARTHTKSKETIVLDGAYHGNTGDLIEISPYKFDGPGGSGAPSFVHKAPLPDGYRGLYRRDDLRAGEKYARHVEQAIAHIQASGKRVGALIAESLMGSCGQIVLPDGFLQEAYRRLRAAGGVCIADEVQVGLGRVGTHFWGFETQGVTPDIVVLGKPIGNGHPLGAVVTTPEIAASFDNGMEYFSTFGGNPVSCAIGLAVLDVIEEEQLQAKALRVGNRLMGGFHRLAETHALIGDVRGLGMFLGIEMVNDRNTLAPAAEQTAYVVNRLKERGILVSVDGPLRNVVKIKPPLAFDETDADFFIETLEGILQEDAAQPRRAPGQWSLIDD